MQKPVALSMVTCSRDDGRFARTADFYARALAGAEHEVVRIADARSMCEGYNRGIRKSSGEIVLLAHDDVEFMCEDFAQRIIRHAEQFDVFGVVGTTKLVGPAWNLSGPPHVYGQVAHDGGGRGLRVSIFNVPARVIERAQALDGIFIAARRRVFDRLSFDERFDDFHLYDIDFSYAAFQMGLKVGVVCDLEPLHHGLGAYDSPQWHRAAQQFLKKHAATLPPLAQQAQWTHALVKVNDRAEAKRVMHAEQFDAK